MKCPYCAEEIQNTAIVCHCCGRDLYFYTPIAMRMEKAEGIAANLDADFKKMQQLLLARETQFTISESYNHFVALCLTALLIGFLFSTISYAYYYERPGPRAMMLWISVFSPLIVGIWIGLVTMLNSFKTRFVIGIFNGLFNSAGVCLIIWSDGRSASAYQVLSKYFFPAALLVFCGSLLGELIAKFIGLKSHIMPRNNALAGYLIKHFSEGDEKVKQNKLERFSIYIAAINAMLSILATIAASYFSYLGLAKK